MGEEPGGRATMNWRGKNVFVTGATGLLGSWLTADLVERGATVTALIRDRVPFALLHEEGTDRRINSVRGDIGDYDLIERALAEYEIEVVFHLAAQTQVLVANRSPMSTFEANVRGTYVLLEACRRHPLLKAVVVASSDKAYGSAVKLPYDEETPLIGRHPYDVSKSCADLIASAYAHSFDLPVCITRCGNLYGGGDLNFSRIIPGTIRSVFYNERPIIRSDGSPIRDYFYVRDAVYAYVQLAEAMLSCGIRGEAFNFSNELQLTVLALTRKILEAMNRPDLEPAVMGGQRGEIQNQWLSAEKARAKLGWSPRFDLESALTETAGWYVKFLTRNSEPLGRSART